MLTYCYTYQCFPIALTILSSMGLLQAPQIGMPCLSWQGRQNNSPLNSRASDVNSLLKMTEDFILVKILFKLNQADNVTFILEVGVV